MHVSISVDFYVNDPTYIMSYPDIIPNCCKFMLFFPVQYKVHRYHSLVFRILSGKVIVFSHINSLNSPTLIKSFVYERRKL